MTTFVREREIAPLECFQKKQDIEKAYEQIFAEIRKHAIEIRYIDDDMVHLRICIEVSKEKFIELMRIEDAV